MMLFVKIIIGCLVAIALVGIVAAAAFYFYIRRAIKNHLLADASMASQFSIHLNEDPAAEWIQNAQPQQLIQDFEALGFSTGTAYTIAEMPQVKCLSLFHPKYNGVIYDIEGMGNFFDLVHIRSEKEGLTVTNMPFAEDFEPIPGREKIFKQEITVAEAHALIDQKSEGHSTVVINDTNFREMVETAYKEEQAYRNRNGGISFEEFQAVNKKGKDKYTEKQIKDGFIEMKTMELDCWNAAGVDEYIEKHREAIEESDLDGCYFVVPAKTDAEAFIHYINDYDLVLDEHVEFVANSVKGEKDIIALFERINNSRSPELRAVERGAISFPVEGRLYQLAA